MSSKGLQFPIVNNQVTQVLEIDHNGRQKQESIDRNETYSLDGRDVIKTEVERDGVEITRYSDANGDGIFVKVSESQQYGSDTGSGVSVGNGSRDTYRDNDNDDYDDNGYSDDNGYQGNALGFWTGLSAINTLAIGAPVGGQTLATGSAGVDHFVVKQLQGSMVIQGFNRLQGDKLVFDLNNGTQTWDQLVSQVSSVTMNGQDMVVGFQGGSAEIVLVGVDPWGVGADQVSVI